MIVGYILSHIVFKIRVTTEINQKLASIDLNKLKGTLQISVSIFKTPTCNTDRPPRAVISCGEASRFLNISIIPGTSPTRANWKMLFSVPKSTLFRTRSPKVGSPVKVMAATKSIVLEMNHAGNVYVHCRVRENWFVQLGRSHALENAGKPT